MELRIQRKKIRISVKNNVNHLVIIALAAIITGVSCTTKTFVTQNPYPDTMCGAYSLAYYKWLKSGKTYSDNEAADRSEVETIFNQVKFGSSYSNVDVTSIGFRNLPVANDPLKMLDYAVEVLGKSTAKFYYDSNNSTIVFIKNLIEANDSTLMKKHSNRVISSGIPTLNVGQYAIVLFLVGKGPTMHWVLCHNTENGLVAYNPSDGEARSITVVQMQGKSSYSILQSLNSCLLLE